MIQTKGLNEGQLITLRHFIHTYKRLDKELLDYVAKSDRIDFKRWLK